MSQRKPPFGYLIGGTLLGFGIGFIVSIVWLCVKWIDNITHTVFEPITYEQFLARNLNVVLIGPMSGKMVGMFVGVLIEYVRRKH